MVGIIGKKLGMTRFFDEAGNSVAATVIEAGPCYVVQVKTKETDGYEAVKMGFGTKKSKSVNKPDMGLFKKTNIEPVAILREMRNFSIDQPVAVGDTIKANVFNAGDNVQVTGTSKGLGFQGVVKRHHFSGGPKTHGQSDRWRAPGSLGQSSYPSRVYKGVRMAGKMGRDRVTLRNIEVLKVDPENNLLVVKGAVPGATGGYLLIRK